MNALQKRHRPRKISHDAIGTLSQGRIRFLQTVQCEGGRTIDARRDNRSIASAMNEPIAAPSATQKTMAISTLVCLAAPVAVPLPSIWRTVALPA